MATTKVKIQPIASRTAREFIKQVHPTGKGTHASHDVAFGLYYDNKLTGVSTWGYNLSAGKTGITLFGKYSTNPHDYLDNLRLIVINPNKELQPSAFLSFCVKQLFKYRKELKYVVAYADGIHGFLGTIYQASNFKYIGKTQHALYWIPNYGLINFRSFRHACGTVRFEYLKRRHPNIQRLYGFNFRYIRFKDKQTEIDLMKHYQLKLPQPGEKPTKADLTIHSNTGNTYSPEDFKHVSFLPYIRLK